MQQPVFIRIFDGESLVAVKQFQASQFVIGNQGEVDLKLEDATVSAIHAMIELRDGEYHLCDLGSEAGTFKNGQPVLDEIVQNGDELQVGKFRLEFFIGIPKPVAKPPPATAEKSESVKPVVKPAVVPMSPPPPVVKPTPKTETPKQEEVTRAFKVEVPPKVTIPAEAPVSFGGLESFEPVKKSKRTFAPKSTYSNLDEIIHPTKGSLVEILVCWGDRVLTTYHCHKNGTVTIGSHPKNDIILPIVSTGTSSLPLLQVINAEARVFIDPSIKGQVYLSGRKISLDEVNQHGKVTNHGGRQAFSLQQGEMIRLDFGESISVYVRYVSPTPKPLMIPFLGLTSTELTGIVVSIIIGGLLYLLSTIKPEVIEVPVPEQEIKVTKFVFTQTFQPPPPPVEPEPTPVATPKPTPTPPPKKVEVKKMETSPLVQKVRAQNLSSGAASQAKPNDSKSQVKKLTSDKKAPTNNTRVDSGGVKSNKNVNAGTTERRDIKNTGLLGAFARGGAQQQLAKANQGAGAIAGLSQSVTGEAGSGGDGPISEGLREVSKGGQGTATVGIADVGTQGRGGGKAGYGSGSIGNKETANIQISESALESEGGIDREAILRVIRNNLAQLRNCYETELNRNPNLYGEVKVNWEVGAAGRVTSARVSGSSMNNKTVENCIITRFKAWRFPEPPLNQSYEVNFPFVFTAK
jgi:TonB family protein